MGCGGAAFFEKLLPDDLIVQVLSFVSARGDLSRVESINRRFRRLPTDQLWRIECFRTWPLYYCQDEDHVEEGRNGGDAEESLNIRRPTDFWKRRYRFIQQDLQRTELTTSELEGLEWNFHFVNSSRTSINRNNTNNGNHAANESNTSLPQESPCYFLDGKLYILEYLWRFAFLEIELLEYEDGSGDDNGDEKALIVSNLLWENRQFSYLSKALAAAGIASSSTDTTYHTAVIASSTVDDPSRQSLRFSYRQSLRIADFALHSVARKVDTGGWMVWNKHVVLTSSGKRRSHTTSPLPPVLLEHLALLRRFDW